MMKVVIKYLKHGFLSVKILVFILFFSLNAPADSSSESLTEAGVGCTTPECLGLPANQSLDEIRKLCVDSLPEYCSEIKKEFTSCYEDDKSFSEGSVASVGACIVGGISGAVDFFVMSWELGGAFGGLLKYEDYREEALDVVSYMMEQIMDSEDNGAKFIQEFLLSPVLEEMDEIISCLNYKGRWEYVCESGVQTYLGVKVFKVGKAIWKPIKNRRKFKLGFLDQLAAKRKLKKRLKAAKKENKLLDIRELDPYEVTILHKKDMHLINVRFMTDEIGEQMSKRQLHAIPVEQIKDLSTRRASRVLNRISNKQFKAVIESDPSKIRDMSMYVVGRNLFRIDPSHIPNLSNIRQMSPSGFRGMSVEQIRSLSPRQLREIIPEQRAALRGAKKRAFDEMYEQLY